MKTLASLAFAGTLVLSVAHAENFTQTNTDRAKAIIDAAIEAHGGSALVDELETLIIENETLTSAVDQSRGTEAPWDQSPSSGYDAIDFGNSVYVNYNKSSVGGGENHAKTIINGEDSYQINYRTGTVAQIAEPDFDTTSGPFFRVTPTLLLRNLKDRESNAHFLGETSVDGTDYNVVGFSMAVGPAISLYFEKDSNLLRRSERVLPGFGLVEYRFDDYVTTAGVPYNKEFTFYFNGDVNIQRTIKSVRVNEPLETIITPEESLAVIPAIAPAPLERQEIADGIWLIGGSGTYAMFVDMGDYVFAAGGTAGIPDRIGLLREVVGDKPLRYGMMTHHHFDHVVGVSAYEQEGATVITSAAHERNIRRAAEDGELLDVKLVDDRLTLETDTQTVEIIDIGPTAHTEHLLVAYLPEEGILFEADHFALPLSGPIAPATSSTKSFAEALARLDLSVRTILSAHSPKAATPDDLRAALEAEVFQAANQD